MWQENITRAFPCVEQCAVIGLPVPETLNGEIPTAFIVVKESINKTDALLKNIENFSKNKMPERDAAMAYQFFEQLPLTLVGKVDYRALEKMAKETDK